MMSDSWNNLSFREGNRLSSEQSKKLLRMTLGFDCG